METLYAIGSLLFVVALVVVIVKLNTKHNPNATFEDVGSLVCLVLVIVLMGCFIAIGVQEDAARKCQQQSSPSCVTSPK